LFWENKSCKKLLLDTFLPGLGRNPTTRDTQTGQSWPMTDKSVPWPQPLFAFPFPPLPQLEGHYGAIGSYQPRSQTRTSPPNTQYLVHTALLMPFILHSLPNMVLLVWAQELLAPSLEFQVRQSLRLTLWQRP
jgi:hypothetical protein